MVVVAIISVIAVIAIPNLLESKMAGNEASAIGTLRSVLSAQSTYSIGVGSGKYASMALLESYRLVDSVVGSGTKDGYSFAITLGPGDTSFMIDARPLNYDFSGRRSFFSNESGVIRFTTANAPATSASPPLGG